MPSARQLSHLCSCVVLAACAAAWAAPAPEQSARILGMGGAGTAAAHGASTIAFNPGSLAFEEFIAGELSFGATFGSVRWSGETGKRVVTLAPAVFLASPIVERLFVGLGAYSDFHFGTRWPADFTRGAEALEAGLSTFTLSLSGAYAFDEHFSVGLGLNLARGSFSLLQTTSLTPNAEALRVSAGAWGFSVNAGLSARFSRDRLRLGLVYRSASTLGFNGSAHLEVPSGEASSGDVDVSGAVTLPHQLTLGVAFKLARTFTLSLDGGYVLASSLSSMPLSFSDSRLDRTLPLGGRNGLTARLGAELKLGDWRLRGGGGYLQRLVSEPASPLLPEGDRAFGSVGLGLELGNLNVDAGYQLSFLLGRTFTGTTHRLALTGGFRF